MGILPCGFVDRDFSLNENARHDFAGIRALNFQLLTFDDERLALAC
jgi:hypothetical protein